MAQPNVCLPSPCSHTIRSRFYFAFRHLLFRQPARSPYMRPPAINIFANNAGQDARAADADAQSASEPAKASSDFRDPAVRDGGAEMAAPYGTRSRNRTGNARINYAEDKDIDIDQLRLLPRRRQEAVATGQLDDERRWPRPRRWPGRASWAWTMGKSHRHRMARRDQSLSSSNGGGSGGVGGGGGGTSVSHAAQASGAYAAVAQAQGRWGRSSSSVGASDTDADSGQPY